MKGFNEAGAEKAPETLTGRLWTLGGILLQ